MVSKLNLDLKVSIHSKIGNDTMMFDPLDVPNVVPVRVKLDTFYRNEHIRIMMKSIV